MSNSLFAILGLFTNASTTKTKDKAYGTVFTVFNDYMMIVTDVLT